jgi:hypothetical protein
MGADSLKKRTMIDKRRGAGSTVVIDPRSLRPTALTSIQSIP